MADPIVERRRKVAEELSLMYHVPVTNTIKALTLSHDNEAKASEWLAAATNRP